MSNNKTYFISGGGTGGHIYPAFTVIEKLLKESDTEKIYFIGNPNNLEFEIAKKYPQVEFLPIDVSGMPRKLNLALIKWGIQLFKAYLKTCSYMKKYKPDAIFTTGGYVSAPAVLASITNKKPYMIHDCDSVAGLVSKMAAPKAKIVSIAFENSKKVLKSNNIIFNGNPVREAFFTVTKENAKEKLNIPQDKTVIFAMGGSQGAKTINCAMVKLLKTLTEEYNAFVILQTGKKNIYDASMELEEIYPEFKTNQNILVQAYFDEMVYPLKASDIVIARAGSVSLSEIIQCHLASILVPYPYAAQDHQRKNAKEMCEKGISLYLEDSDCNDKNLLQKIKEALSNHEQMSEKAKNLVKTNPTEEIVKQLKSIIQ
ncbi:MAG: undecaprenyldiphospho-muramoylpentapeptide beta-N-acetylglucosaminyltransferase [Cyanobacteria bacterium SIG29]|nr:undecaprenyldiphospho-muramoylpentapeptide beta-N-acetylglucosaminyltransferase [Cyanobacteria bacterium SIG29]